MTVDYSSSPDVIAFVLKHGVPAPWETLRELRCNVYSPVLTKWLESILLLDRTLVVVYARDVINGRWPEAEEVILQSSHTSVAYAVAVLKHKWPIAEEYYPKIERFPSYTALPDAPAGFK